MTVSNFISKAFSYKDLDKEGYYVPPSPPLPQKYPGADSYKENIPVRTVLGYQKKTVANLRNISIYHKICLYLLTLF